MYLFMRDTHTQRQETQAEGKAYKQKPVIVKRQI